MNAVFLDLVFWVLLTPIWRYRPSLSYGSLQNMTVHGFNLILILIDLGMNRLRVRQKLSVYPAGTCR
eukprot:SAG11_NODE_2611_length_3173_cov_1.719909_2_plen_67_part_00